MGCKLIFGDTFKQEFDGVMAELKRNYNSDRRAMHVVLVPDKFSLTMEKEVLESLGLSGSANVQVLSFLRFAGRVMKNKIKNCLTPQGVVMLLAKVIGDVRDKLSVYKNASYTAGFAGEMYASLTSLRNSGITVEALKDSIPRLKSAVLREKVADMAVILEAYLAELAKGYADSTTRLEKLAEYIPTAANLSRTYFYVTDIYKFTAPEYAVLEALAKTSPSVTVGLPLGGGENKRLFPYNVKAHLEAAFERAGVTVKTERVSGGLSPQAQTIVDNLYSYRGVLPKTADGKIEICFAADEFSECEEVASKIIEAVVVNDYRYKDMAVVVPDETYVGPLKAAFDRFDVPYFVDESRVFSSTMPIKYLLSMLDYSMTQKVDDALEAIKNPMFLECGDLTYDDVDLFENAVLPTGAERSNFKKPFDGADARAEEVRKKFVSVVPHFKKTDSAGNYVSRIEEFLAADNFFNKIECFCKSMAADAKTVKSLAQTESRLTAVFSEIKNAIGSAEMDFEEFCRIFKSTLESVKISLTPLYLDCVFVGSAADSRFEGVKTMFVIGATASAMPEGVGNPAIISADDEVLLKEAGLVVSPSKIDDVLSAMFYLTELVVRPTEKLVVSYPKTLAGVSVQPSTLIDQLCLLFSDLEVSEPRFGALYSKADMSDEDLAREYAFRFGSRKNAYYSVLSNLSELSVSKRERKPFDAAFSLLTDDEKYTVNRALGGKEEQKLPDGADLFFKDFKTNEYVTSVSQLEKYFTCPLQNYFAYGLRLQKRVTDVIENSLTGSFVHEVLEKYFTLFAEGKKDVTGISDSEIASLVEEIAVKASREKEFAAFTSSDKHKKSFLRLKTDCVKICVALTDLLKGSSYRPYKLEAAFWNGNVDRFGEEIKNVYKPLTFTVGGRNVALRGKIDRIDVFEDKFYIIDYKSYGKSIKFSDVFFGTAIQLVAYMTAIAKEEGFKPTGVFYLPVTVGYKSAATASTDENRFAANGFFDSAYDRVCEIENAVYGLKAGKKAKGRFLKTTFSASAVKPSDDGSGRERVVLENEETGVMEVCEIKTSSSGAVTSDTLDGMGQYVSKLVEGAISEISGGYVQARPLQRACEHCDYKEICPDRTSGGRVLPKIEADGFKKALEDL